MSFYILFIKLFKDILLQREREDGDNNGEFDDVEVFKQFEEFFCFCFFIEW